MPDHNYLFLQSHPSKFGRDLYREMIANGAKCHLINLSLGDWIYRLGLKAVNYTGTLQNWDQFLSEFIKTHKITRIIYYSDQRPYHRIARQIAIKHGIEAFAYEFGYLRPDWITLEKSGMGVFSHFPDDPELIKNLAKNFEYDVPETVFGHTLFTEAFNEVLYNFTPALFPFLFKHYERDRYYHPLIDYPSYVPRLLMRKVHINRGNRLIQRLIKENSHYYLIPLQMQADYQVRRCSHYHHMSEMIEEAIQSFARNAPVEAKLIFKLHPLDNNLERWHDIIKNIARQYSCDKRIHVIDLGDLHPLLAHSKGVVLINSTTGLTALQIGIPVKALSVAIFDIKGMTHQSSLDSFWTAPEIPDKELVDAFVKLIARTIHIKGSFFSKKGRQIAAKEFVKRIMNNEVNHFGAYISPPPRLSKAKQMSIPMIYESDELYSLKENN